MTISISNNQSPRIAIDALNLSHGGGVIVLKRVVDALMLQGAEVILFTARDSVLQGLNMRPTYTSFHPEAAGAIKAAMFRIFKMRSLLDAMGADGILSFNFRTPVQLPQVTYHINVIPYLPLNRRRTQIGLMRAVFQTRVAQQALRKNAANAFESQHLLNLARKGNKPSLTDFVAYTGIDIPPTRRERIFPCGSKTICIITSGANHKNNDDALRAFRLFSERSDDSFLDVFGEPEAIMATLSPEMKKYCEDSCKVRFRGYVGSDELHEALSKAFALITASELESFYMVALEAMIAGCPVVAADISSVRESTSETAHLFPVGDWLAAAKALLALKDTEQWLTTSDRGRRWAANFDADKLAENFATQLVDIFRKAST